MAARNKPPVPRAPLVWERPEPAPRPAPEPLSREKIVRAAFDLADAEGLAAVSLRKVGAALDAGPMRLYGYLETKEELLELMADGVYAEIMSAGAPRGEWRDAVRMLARRLRKAAHAHPWFVALLSGRLHLGPNAIAYLEATLAAFLRAPGFDIDAALTATRVVTAYAVGAIGGEAGELRAERESGLTKKQWQEASWPYIQRLVESGKYPTFALSVRDATHASPDALFDEGLACVLDGIAARHEQ
ncbi:MAG: transcriptional regulator, TetR family [Labilithrix sp.]|nr:transcriptional regulator, TetR family [Labilithrix sp.]